MRISSVVHGRNIFFFTNHDTTYILNTEFYVLKHHFRKFSTPDVVGGHGIILNTSLCTR